MKNSAILFSLALVLSPAAARGDTLDQVLNVVLPLIDHDLATAEPFVRCVVNGGNAQTCAQNFAKGKAASATSSNPKLAAAVSIVKAIQKHDWITVLDVGGTGLLFPIACSVSMPPAGPLKDFLCSSATSELAKLAQPVLRTALECVRDGNWPKLITTIGPSIACSLSIIPSEIRVPACTGLDYILKGSLAAFKTMLDGLGDEVNALLSAGDRLLGSEVKKLTPKQYFAVFWAPYLAKATGLKMSHADPAYGQLMFKLTYNCPGYFGKSAPCDAMKSVFGKAVSQSGLAVQALELPYVNVHLKPDLLPHYLHFVASKGSSVGGVGNCQSDLYHELPLPSGDGDAAANPNPWSIACTGVEDALRAEIEKNKVVLFIETEPVLKKGCTITTNGTFYCPNYAGDAACRKILPTHPGACVLDQSKAALALSDEILAKLGAKRCATKGPAGWEHKIIECTRPWKRQTCASLVSAVTPAGVNDKVNCNDKPDPAFDQAKAKAHQVVQILNSGAVNVAVRGAAPSILATGKPYAFKPASCAPSSPDPLKIGCQDWPVVADVASKVGFVNLPTCAGDPHVDGAVHPVLHADLLPGDPALTAGTDVPGGAERRTDCRLETGPYPCGRATRGPSSPKSRLPGASSRRRDPATGMSVSEGSRESRDKEST